MAPEELTNLESKALDQFKKGKPPFGKDGAFAPFSLLKSSFTACL